MAQSTGAPSGSGASGTGGGSPGAVEWMRQIFFAGAALTIPAIVTVLILVLAVNFILGLVSPAVAVLTDVLNVGREIPAVALEMLAVVTLLGVVFVVGFVAETRTGGGIEESFDSVVARIPAVGPVYTSFNEMSDLLLSGESRSFREVKLVEYPTEGSYAVAFVTADAPSHLERATGHDDVTTLFVPLAPNPVMGGFVLHVSTDRVHDVDITVEEGIQSILTNGVTVGGKREVAAGDIGEFEGAQAERTVDPTRDAIVDDGSVDE